VERCLKDVICKAARRTGYTGHPAGLSPYDGPPTSHPAGECYRQIPFLVEIVAHRPRGRGTYDMLSDAKKARHVPPPFMPQENPVCQGQNFYFLFFLYKSIFLKEHATLDTIISRVPSIPGITFFKTRLSLYFKLIINIYKP
jgi:hypothetical protein